MTNVSFVVNRFSCNGEDFRGGPAGIAKDSDRTKCKTRDLVGHWQTLPAGYANENQTITSLNNVPESTVILHDYCHGHHTVKAISNDYRYLVLADQNDRDKLTDSVVKSLFDRKILVIRPTEKVNPQAVNDEIKRKESDASATFYHKNDKSKLYDKRFDGKQFDRNISPSKLAEAGWLYSLGLRGEGELYCIYRNHGRVGIQRERDGNAFIPDFNYREQLVHFKDCRTIASLEKMHYERTLMKIPCKENFKRIKLQEKPLLINNDGVDQSGPLYQFCGPEDSGCSKAFILSHKKHPVHQVKEDEKRKILHDAMLTKVETMKPLRESGRDNTPVYQDCLRDFIWLNHFDNLLQNTQKNVENYIDLLCDNFNHISENDKPTAFEIIANLSDMNLRQYLSPLVDELAKYGKKLTIVRKLEKLEGMDKDIRDAGVDALTQKAKEEFTLTVFQKPFISEPVAGYLAQGDFASKFVNLTDDTPERIKNLKPLAEAGNQLQVSLGLLQDKVRQLSNSRLDLEQIVGSAETPAQSIEVMGTEPGPSTSAY